MARGLQNYPEVTTPDSDYPNGRIIDDSGTENGTPVNEEVYGDAHQFLAKILREAGITANGFPENEYSGHQYYEALDALIYANNNDRLLFQIIEIGEWNMDTTANVSVTLFPGSPGVFDRNKVVSVDCLIKRDDGGTEKLEKIDITTFEVQGAIGTIQNPSLVLYRKTAGFFDDANFSASGNRGYLFFVTRP